MRHKQRIMAAMRGEMADVLPYVPRIDMWYNANSLAGSLPEKHRGRTQDEISRAEGWALHKVLPDLIDLRTPEDVIHRGIGVYATRHGVHRFRFPSDIDIRVNRKGDSTRIEYHTPVGIASTTTVFTDDLRRAGSTLPFITEPPIKRLEDFQPLAYIFEHLELIPHYDDFLAWQEGVGEDGFCCAFASLASSPMHHIQKDFLGPTEFYFFYHDHRKEMESLAEAVEHYYDQLLQICADSPAEGIFWGGNFDDMITYPPYFEKEIMPWIHKVADVLHERGKMLDCHCDGENLGLMDLIKDSGMDIAEAICPYPMTKVRIEQYYAMWSDTLTIFGGIPSNILLADLASEEEFEAYLDHLFQVITPGRRFIAGIADTTPPDAVFERLVRIGERVEQEARLPLEGGSVRPLSEADMEGAAARVSETKTLDMDTAFNPVQEDVFRGDDLGIEAHILALIDQSVSPQDILQKGLIAAMEIIGPKFKNGELFIPEVLLSSRAMNKGIAVLEPFMSDKEKEAAGKVLIGTVKGDLHDIGKNMVITMLRGVGFEIRDLGIDVPVERFIEHLDEYKPHIIGLSALLTTTMPEMKKVIDELKKRNKRDQVKVIVGGAPVNERYAREVGADGYAPDAASAVDLVKDLLATSAISALKEMAE